VLAHGSRAQPPRWDSSPGLDEKCHPLPPSLSFVTPILHNFENLQVRKQNEKPNSKHETVHYTRRSRRTHNGEGALGPQPWDPKPSSLQPRPHSPVHRSLSPQEHPSLWPGALPDLRVVTTEAPGSSGPLQHRPAPATHPDVPASRLRTARRRRGRAA
jgi:hypothetical protein